MVLNGVSWAGEAGCPWGGGGITPVTPVLGVRLSANAGVAYWREGVTGVMPPPPWPAVLGLYKPRRVGRRTPDVGGDSAFGRHHRRLGARVWHVGEIRTRVTVSASGRAGAGACPR